MSSDTDDTAKDKEQGIIVPANVPSLIVIWAGPGSPEYKIMYNGISADQLAPVIWRLRQQVDFFYNEEIQKSRKIITPGTSRH